MSSSLCFDWKRGLKTKEEKFSSKANDSYKSNTPNGQARQTMAPTANDTAHDLEFALQKDELSIARSMIEQQREHNDREEKIAAFVLARRIEARKQEELELAQVIRRRHEDEQIQKHLLSLRREREIIRHDPQLLAMSLSAGETDSLRSNAASRLANELSLLRGSNSAKGNEGGAYSQLGSARLMSLSGYDGMLRPTTSQFLGSAPLSSRTSNFLDSQAMLAERLQLRSELQLNGTDLLDSNRPLLSHHYPSRPSISMPASQDITSLRRYYSGITGSGILGTMMHGNTAIPASSMHAANFLTGAEAGLGASLLRSPSSAGTASSGIVGIASSQQQKRLLEGSDDDLFLNAPSKRLKMLDQTSGIGSPDPEDDQQQQRFNKHQCKQWTLKFRELLAFKDRTGHW